MVKDYCKNCKKENHCCVFLNDTSGFVFVSIKEVNKIKKHTKQEYDKFVEYKKLSKRFINWIKKEDPSLEGYMRYKQIVNGKIPALKTKKNGECIFLNKEKKCSIYDTRPNICKMYPYWGIKLNDGKIVIIKHDHESNCNYLKKPLSIKEKYDLVETFKAIKSDEKSYKKDIKKLNKLFLM